MGKLSALLHCRPPSVVQVRISPLLKCSIPSTVSQLILVMVPPGQNDASSDDVICSWSPSPTSGESWLIQADQPLLHCGAGFGVVGTTRMVVGARVVVATTTETYTDDDYTDSIFSDND